MGRTRKFKLEGMKIHKLFIKDYLGNDKYLCLCDCGTLKEIRGGDIRNGKTSSCGCHRKEYVTFNNTTHNLRGHRLYRIYHNMISRCYNVKVDCFKHYGERGILVCGEWLKKDVGFINFYNWAIKHEYNNKLTLDRINNDGMYTPDNCRWVSLKIQANNRTDNVYVTINNQIKTLQEWCDFYKINTRTVRDRLKRGWDVFTSLSAPVDMKFRRKDI